MVSILIFCFRSPSPSSLLALQFREWLGGEHKINAYCHNLALKGGERLAELWGTRLMDPTGEFTLNMVRPRDDIIVLPLHI